MPTLDVAGVRVEYTDRGAGLPLVFVPGLYGSSDWFRYQTLGLSDRYRVIACSTRAVRGQSGYSLALLADDLMRFLDALKVYGAVVVGHTLGAAVALELAARSPDRVLAVVAMSAAPSYEGVSAEEMIAHLSPGEAEPETLLTRMKRWFGVAQKRTVDDDADPLACLVQQGGCVDKATLSARLNLMLSEDIKPLLPEVAAPTLVVAGSLEWSRILRGSQLIDQLTPNSTLEVLEGADHFCFYTRHDMFNMILDEFVSREVPRP